jgi:hypothetical protein
MDKDKNESLPSHTESEHRHSTLFRPQRTYNPELPAWSPAVNSVLSVSLTFFLLPSKERYPITGCSPPPPTHLTTFTPEWSPSSINSSSPCLKLTMGSLSHHPAGPPVAPLLLLLSGSQPQQVNSCWSLREGIGLGCCKGRLAQDALSHGEGCQAMSSNPVLLPSALAALRSPNLFWDKLTCRCRSFRW